MNYPNHPYVKRWSYSYKFIHLLSDDKYDVWLRFPDKVFIIMGEREYDFNSLNIKTIQLVSKANLILEKLISLI